MSDGNRFADAASGDSGPADERRLQYVGCQGEHGVLLPEKPSSLGDGGVSPATRSLAIRNLLNDVNDEVVGGSDQDGDQDSTHHNEVDGDVANESSTDRGVHEVEPNAAALLMAFTDSSPSDAILTGSSKLVGASEESPSLHQEGDILDPNVDPTETTRLSETREPGDDHETGGARKNTVPSRRPVRAVRPPIKTKAPIVREAKPKSIKSKFRKSHAADNENDVDIVLVPGPSADLLPTPSITSPRMRDKRRPPAASPNRVIPLKKSKTMARPRRAAAPVHNYVDVTGSDQEDPDTQAEMVIANFGNKVNSTTGVDPGNRHTASVSMKTKKRKSISQRQLEELMTEEREAGSSSRIPLEGLDRTLDTVSTFGLLLRPCEFCRQKHSAHAVFKCHSCLRVYHEKCLVDAFRSEVLDAKPIEEQMEHLHLYRPTGHSAVLRCSSCQAALIDFHNNRGFHWDCPCPTCTTVPGKIADYRRVSLKRIIDEHNLEFALKKEKKGSGTIKQPSTGNSKTVSPVKLDQSKSVREEVPEVKAVSVGSQPRWARASRRSRVEVLDETTPHGANEPNPSKETDEHAASYASKSRMPSAGRGRKGGSRGNTDYGLQHGHGQAMGVDQEGSTSEPTALNPLRTPSSGDQDHGDVDMDKATDGEPFDEITSETLEDLIAITKEDNDTWSFTIACSSSKKSNESGTYKEATLYWHPGRDKSLKCSCCNKMDQSLKWFIQHTDTKLLSRDQSNQGVIDIYAYVFVIQKNRQLVPLQNVIALLRQRYGQTANDPARSDLTGGTNRRPSGKKKHEVDARQQALELLRDVKYSIKTPDQVVGNRRRPSIPASFSCDVICAERGRWLRPLGGNELILRNTIADCSVSADVYKTGTLDVCASAKNFKSCRIRCGCCGGVFSGSKFVQHTREPLLAEEQRNNKLEEGAQNHRDDDAEDDWDHTPDTTDSNEAEVSSGKKIRTFSCVIGVVMRDNLSSIRLDAFLSALEKLGSQGEINKAIAAITKTQDTSVPANS